MQENHTFKLDDFDYHLPEALIAQYPTSNRSASRLLIATEPFQDENFKAFCQQLKPHDLLIFNNTKVLKARLYGQKTSGGKIEALLERLITPSQGIFQIKASHAPKIGEKLIFQNYTANVLERQDGFFKLDWQDAQNISIDIEVVLEEIGHLPLPPYIKHQADDIDEQRYQTIFAKEKGAIAAPTASLHFDEATFEQLNALKSQQIDYDFLTLHIGAGTFSPVRVDDIKNHQMHQESYSISTAVLEKIARCKQNNGRVIAIGTTSLRALESAYQNFSALNHINIAEFDDLKNIKSAGDTKIFIYPGYEFKVVDALLTNFHLPKSTLFMLLSAFMGLQKAQATYAHAIEKQYRFFSYGDAMFCQRA